MPADETTLGDFRIPASDPGTESPALLCLRLVLGYLRTNTGKWNAEARAHLGAAGELRDQLKDALDGIALDSSLSWIRQRVGPVIAPANRPIAARGVALALDGLLGDYLHLGIRNHYLSRAPVRVDSATAASRFRLRRRDPVPDTRATIGSMPSDRSPDRVDHVLLAPDSFNGFRVWVDYSLSDVKLAKTASIFTAHPVEKGWHEYEGKNPSTGPLKDFRGVSQRTLDLFAQAARSGASLFVLPEGAVTAELLSQLRDHWEGLGRPAQPAVIVAGSAYETVGGKLRNRSYVFGVRGLDGACDLLTGSTHEKFAPVYPSGDDPREPIAHRTPSLTVHVLDGGVTLAVLICRDALVPTAARLLEDLQVDFVVIPGFNEDIRPFRQLAGYWATNWGITTVVASTRTRGGADAVVGRRDIPDGGVWVGPGSGQWFSLVGAAGPPSR